jgi:hypothetical protein
VVIFMRAARALAVFSLALLLGCGGRRSLETQLERHPADVLPQGAAQIASARLDRLRNNPLAVLAYERAKAANLGPALKGILQALEPAGDLNRVALAVYGAAIGRDAAAVVVAAGRLSEDIFRKSLELARLPYVEGTHDGRRFYTCGRGNERCYVSFVSPRLVVASSQEDLLKRALDLGRSGAKSMARDRGFAPLLDSFSPQMDLWVTGAFPRALSSAFGEQLEQALQLIRAFTIRLTGGEPARFDLTLHCGSTEAAQADAVFLQKLLASTTQEMVAAGYKISDLINVINRSRIVVGEATAEFKIEIGKAELAATAAALRAEPTAPPIVFLPPVAAPEK